MPELESNQVVSFPKIPTPIGDDATFHQYYPMITAATRQLQLHHKSQQKEGGGGRIEVMVLNTSSYLVTSVIMHS